MLYAAARPSEKDLKCGAAFPSALCCCVITPTFQFNGIFFMHEQLEVIRLRKSL
jgi:hypothetical protein